MNTLVKVSLVSLFNDDGRASLLLVCERASNYIPAHLENLRLADEVLHSHAALDIGALELAQNLSQLLDAPLLSTGVSRLVYDCNRGLGASGAIPEKSEVFEIPGNQNLTEADPERDTNLTTCPSSPRYQNAWRDIPNPPCLSRFIALPRFTMANPGRLI